MRGRRVAFDWMAEQERLAVQLEVQELRDQNRALLARVEKLEAVLEAAIERDNAEDEEIPKHMADVGTKRGNAARKAYWAAIEEAAQ